MVLKTCDIQQQELDALAASNASGEPSSSAHLNGDQGANKSKLTTTNNSYQPAEKKVISLCFYLKCERIHLSCPLLCSINNCILMQSNYPCI